MSSKGDGIVAGRLDAEEYARNFSDSHAPLHRVQALIEAERRYYCYDAPCIKACPTGIDIPTFIQRIAQDNVRGAAKAILEENILGGMCARVCPTEVLCEQACVRNTNEDKPVEIGLLQRYATDGYFAKPGAPLFTRRARAASAPRWWRRSCGPRVRPPPRDARPRRGRCSTPTEAGRAERVRPRHLQDGRGLRAGDRLAAVDRRHRGALQPALGRDIVLDDLCAEYDAVFLGMGSPA
jgi:glutamate synthase (NADPH/NADH) small chain